MRFRDISLRKRLWAANLLMVTVPLCALLAMGTLFLGFLHMTDADHLGPLSLFWPERGPSLTVHYLVSDLKTKAEKDFKKENSKDNAAEILEDCRLFEQQGVKITIFRDGMLIYATPGCDPRQMEAQIAQVIGMSPSAELWTEDVFAMRYISKRGNVKILASGIINPRAPANGAGMPLKKILEIVLFITLLLVTGIVILLGRYLSRLLEKQVLTPLAKLRKASAAIQQGNLDHELHADARDEVGQVCAGFERMRQKLCQARAERIHYEENRKELIAGISHDLRTPLTAIRGYVSGLRDGIARTEEKRRHYLAMIYDSVLLLEHLVNNLFLFSKLDSGHMVFQQEKVSIGDYLQHYIANVDLGSGQAEIHLQTDGMDENLMAMIDPLQFKRVLDNLLSNSIKYSRPDHAAIDLILQRDGNQLIISWQDHGQGVQPAQLTRLFDSFYRTDMARTHVADGSGLGLAISKEIILGMHGHIEAKMTAGGGLTIVMRLPLAGK